MASVKEEIGKRYGRLLVVAEAECKIRSSGQREMRWECLCDCGATTVVSGNNLRRGHTSSCGCFKFERIREAKRGAPGKSGFNALLANYKKSAKKRNLLWALSDEQFADLTRGSCYWCSEPPTAKFILRSDRSPEGVKHSTYVYSGVDRMNNRIGYTPENCVSCCAACNFAKREMSIDEWFAWLQKIAARRPWELAK